MDTLESKPADIHELGAAEIGALAHLYRGEVYRSTVWRTRLDNTTNWAVAGLGIALSISFSNKEASALPLLLIGVLIVVFLIFEARRYRLLVAALEKLVKKRRDQIAFEEERRKRSHITEEQGWPQPGALPDGANARDSVANHP
jgi:uncharacterized membrane protein